MDKAAQKVLVIGGGVAGLAAAYELALLNVGVELVEKADFLGGHGIQFACKAAGKCVTCGACVVEEKLEHVVQNPKIKVSLGTTLEHVTTSRPFSVRLHRRSAYIDPQKCTGCRICFERCPLDGAVARGFSIHNVPLYAINKEKCLYFKDKSCRECEILCPEGAIKLDKKESTYTTVADAIIVAVGFHTFNPQNTPYGYNIFQNVITNLDLERMLRREGIVKRPSDHRAPQKIAFVQCVGSRDSSLNHLWCSKVCCGSALRMARRIKTRQPETEITFFYIDVQTFGRDFQNFYQGVQKDVRRVRAIPGEIFPAKQDRLRVNYYAAAVGKSLEEDFDMVVLSVGMEPAEDTKYLAGLFNLEIADSGFIRSTGHKEVPCPNGIFSTGAVLGPMGIAETIAHAGSTAFETLTYLESKTDSLKVTP